MVSQSFQLCLSIEAVWAWTGKCVCVCVKRRRRCGSGGAEAVGSLECPLRCWPWTRTPVGLCAFVIQPGIPPSYLSVLPSWKSSSSLIFSLEKTPNLCSPQGKATPELFTMALLAWFCLFQAEIDVFHKFTKCFLKLRTLCSLVFFPLSLILCADEGTVPGTLWGLSKCLSNEWMWFSFIFLMPLWTPERPLVLCSCSALRPVCLFIQQIFDEWV